MPKLTYTKLMIFGIVVSLAIPTALVIIVAMPQVIDSQTTTEYYTGKVIQVEHISTSSGSFLFGGSTQYQTYVTFDNGQTYWKAGYITIVEGHIYQVQSVKTVERGTGMNSTGPFNQGSVTTVVNTFTEVS